MKTIKWNSELDQFIKNNASSQTDEQLASSLTNKLGYTVTMQKVRKRRQKLGIKKVSGRGKCEIVKQEIIYNECIVPVSKLNYPSKDSVDIVSKGIKKKSSIMGKYNDLF